MSWGLLIAPRGSPWAQWLSVTAVAPDQGDWYDPSRLLDPQPRARTRLRSASDGTAAIAVDLGAPAETITHVALVSTTLAAGTMRLRGSASDSAVVSSLAFDSGALSLVDLADPETGSIVVAVTSSGASQFLRLDLDGQEPEGFVDIGLFCGGAAVTPSRNFQFGTALGRLDLSQRDVSADSGVSFGRAGPAPRTWSFQVPHPRAETMWAGDSALTDRLRRVAAAQQDVLAIPDTAETDPAVLSRMAIWGRLEAVGGDVWEQFDVVRTPWRVTERI